MAGIKGCLIREIFLSDMIQSDSGLHVCESHCSTLTCVCSDVCDSTKTDECLQKLGVKYPCTEKFDTMALHTTETKVSGSGPFDPLKTQKTGTDTKV